MSEDRGVVLHKAWVKKKLHVKHNGACCSMICLKQKDKKRGAVVAPLFCFGPFVGELNSCGCLFEVFWFR